MTVQELLDESDHVLGFSSPSMKEFSKELKQITDNPELIKLINQLDAPEDEEEKHCLNNH
ncbi:hypothetical protein HON22_05095 [Candidatus Peregrinibacteria bacterium]|nr:hypothetical protein [Candidatus Peregrinibacteria bacterium]